LIRRGDSLVVYGRAGLAEAPHPLGGDDAVASVAEADRVIALAEDRLHAWNDRAPDPDRPLLLDDRRGPDGRLKDPPTRWWVYASILGAVAAGAAIIYATDATSNRQRVELHQP
jgi:hypothetical protein